MEIGIYTTANIIYLVRELYLGDRIGGFSLLERWVVTTLFVGRHFPSVLWPLAGDVRRINCSFIVLALDIHVFCLRAEAEGAILHTTKKVWGMRSEFSIHMGWANASLWLHLRWTFVLQNVGRSEWVRSQKRLSAQWRKDWHGLHESSYRYFEVNVGTRNLK